MEARLKLKPGQNGTKTLLARFGERLVCVRYRYDEERSLRFTTVELIGSHSTWQPRKRARASPRSPHDMVYQYKRQTGQVDMSSIRYVAVHTHL
jgi:hypothetical protein